VKRETPDRQIGDPPKNSKDADKRSDRRVGETEKGEVETGGQKNRAEGVLASHAQIQYKKLVRKKEGSREVHQARKTAGVESLQYTKSNS